MFIRLIQIHRVVLAILDAVEYAVEHDPDNNELWTGIGVGRTVINRAFDQSGLRCVYEQNYPVTYNRYKQLPGTLGSHTGTSSPTDLAMTITPEFLDHISASLRFMVDHPFSYRFLTL